MFDRKQRLLEADSKPKLALLTTTVSPAAGGLAASIPPLAFRLDQSGRFETHVIGTVDPKAPEAAAAWGPRVHAHKVLGIRAFKFAPSLSTSLQTLAPDVVDVQGLWTYPSLANLRHHRYGGCPYVITPRGMLDPWALDRSRLKKRLVRTLFEDSHLHCATCLRATAEMEATHFRDFNLHNPIAIIPNGVDVPPLVRSKRKTGGPCRLLFLSRLHPKKGLPFLLRAWAAIAQQRQDWELIIAGPDEVGHEAEMRALETRLAAPRIRWIGAVDGPTKTALYRSADLFVLPTHTENFGLVIAEALAAGVPAIVTKGAPWAGLKAERCGWFINHGVEPLRSTLLEATALPPEERREMGQRGRAWMERDFGWEGIGERMIDLYEWVLGRQTRPSFVF